MQSTEEEIKINDQDFNENCSKRVIKIFISEVNDHIYLYSSLQSNSSANNFDESKHNEFESDNLNEAVIIDISKLIKKKSIDSIRMLTVKSIDPDLNFAVNSSNKLEVDNSDIENSDSNTERELDLTQGLLNRKRNEKLSLKQLEYVKNKVSESIMTTKQLSNQLNLSVSLINKIKRNELSQLWRGRSDLLIKVFGTERKTLIKELQKFVKNPNAAFNSHSITNHVNRVLSRNYKPYYIRNLMKNELRMSFKKVKPRPNNIDFDILKASLQLFAVKFTQLMTAQTIVINIYETLFSRSIQNNYSWSYKGVPYKAKNSPFTGSINWIMSICSWGSWFLLLTNHTSNSDIFELFLNKLNDWIATNDNFQGKEVLIVMDNWSIHKSKQIMQKLKYMKWKVAFLPAYTPLFAPIEMWFSRIKQILRSRWNSKVVKLSNKESFNEIYSCLKEIKSEDVKILFKEMYSTIDKYL